MLSSERGGMVESTSMWGSHFRIPRLPVDFHIWQTSVGRGPVPDKWCAKKIRKIPSNRRLSNNEFSNSFPHGSELVVIENEWLVSCLTIDIALIVEIFRYQCLQHQTRVSYRMNRENAVFSTGAYIFKSMHKCELVRQKTRVRCYEKIPVTMGSEHYKDFAIFDGKVNWSADGTSLSFIGAKSTVTAWLLEVITRLMQIAFSHQFRFLDSPSRVFRSWISGF